MPNRKPTSQLSDVIIADNIRLHLISQNHSPETFATKTGIPLDGLTACLRGERPFAPDSLVAIALGLNMDVKKLIIPQGMGVQIEIPEPRWSELQKYLSSVSPDPKDAP